MNAISKSLSLAVLTMSFGSVAFAAPPLTMSGEANGKTCSQLVAECVNYNRADGSDVSRCAGYKTTCMATGTYSDRKRTITGVTKK